MPWNVLKFGFNLIFVLGHFNKYPQTFLKFWLQQVEFMVRISSQPVYVSVWNLLPHSTMQAFSALISRPSSISIYENTRFLSYFFKQSFEYQHFSWRREIISGSTTLYIRSTSQCFLISRTKLLRINICLQSLRSPNLFVLLAPWLMRVNMFSFWCLLLSSI